MGYRSYPIIGNFKTAKAKSLEEAETLIAPVMAHVREKLGDVVYGRKKPELGQDSQCLHAGTLCFFHPRDGRPVMVFAPLPEYFQKVIDKLEKMILKDDVKSE